MSGKVYLVGAGPGDPGLITVAGLERIKAADVIVYDRLVSPQLLDQARPDAERIYVGKAPGAADAHDQPAINRLLIEKARAGHTVVRLKGGDPFVFGRGGEEAEALHQAGVPFEVVPGVTSAVAVPAYAGIPVTHRGLASTFAVITGHESPDKSETAVNWPHLANAVDTLVFLMGVKNLPDIVSQLIANGRTPETPVAVIQQGTTPQQRTVTGTLGDIVARAGEAGLTPPAITVVGEVVRLRDALSWFEARPLFGKRVLITRTRRQASALARLLAEQGAVPLELPSIEIEPIGDERAVEGAVEAVRSGEYAWVIFTSANAVEFLFAHLESHAKDARVFGSVHVAAIGPATAGALARWGIVADLVPEEYVAESVVSAMRHLIVPGQRVLLPRAESARAELLTGLEALGAKVTEVPIYRAVVPDEAPPEVLADLREGRVDIVTFTSSSTVRNLVSMLGEDAPVILSGGHDRTTEGAASRRDLVEGEPPAMETRRPLIACIGPITEQTARDLGLRVDVVAPEHTVEGLVAALIELVKGAAA